MHNRDHGNILIVDDDEQIIRMICQLLHSRGWNCILAHSGAQALDQFGKMDVDLILTDLNMNLGDGLELIRAIRRKSDAPILVISGFTKQYANQVRFLRNVHLFAKPVDASALLKQVRVSFREERRAREMRQAA
jgi:two-component system response regulator ResD